MYRMLIVFAFLSVLGVGTGFSQVPQMITYQGLLTDDTGSPVADGDYTLTFGIYDVATGGTALWSETQSSVSVAGGLFKVFLGSGNPITLAFDVPYWLEVQVGSGSPQSPRVTLTTVPYSYMATDSDQVDRLNASATPTANTLLALDGTGKFPVSAIPAAPPGGAAGGDLTGTYPDPTIAAGAVSTAKLADNAATTAKIAPDVVSSIDGVSNDGGDIDLIGGANVTITPDDAANTITIGAVGGGGGDITSVWPGDATLWGGADQGDVTLGVAVPLELEGVAPPGSGVIKGTDTSFGNYGLLGLSAYGVWGENSSGPYGYLGSSNWGVWGGGGGGYGYLGGSEYGAYGYNYATTNKGYLGGSDYGAYGFQSGTGNWGYLGGYAGGAYGVNSSGAYGYLGGYAGAYGRSASDAYGALGVSNHGAFGVHATNGCIGWLGHDDAGVNGYDGSGLYWAGRFEGDAKVTGFLWVDGDLYVGGANKNFLIDHPLHPENKMLRHACVESPENLLIYRAKATLDADGEARVEMPDYFTALAKEDEATVTLTSVGKPFLTGYEWGADYRAFTVYGDPSREVSWVVYADRDDPAMRQGRLPVEMDKEFDSKLCPPGKLLTPTAYGYPESMGAGYEERQEAIRRHEEMWETPAQTRNASATGARKTDTRR